MMSRSRALLLCVSVLCIAAASASSLLACGKLWTAGDAGVDAGSAMDALVDGCVQTPTCIFGSHLSFWFDGDHRTTVLVDAGRVERWIDRSTNHHEAYAVFHQANDLVWEDSAVRGRGAIRFSGDRVDAAVLETTGDLGYVNGDFLLVVVASYNNPPGYPATLFVDRPGFFFVANSCTESRVFGGSRLEAPDRYNCADSGIGVWSGSSGWNDGTPHVFSLRQMIAASTIAVRIDGAETSSVQATALSAGGGDIGGGHPWVGEGWFGTEWSLGGYISEVIGVDGSYGTPEEVAALDAYLRRKYGLSF